MNKSAGTLSMVVLGEFSLVLLMVVTSAEGGGTVVVVVCGISM